MVNNKKKQSARILQQLDKISPLDTNHLAAIPAITLLIICVCKLYSSKDINAHFLPVCLEELLYLYRDPVIWLDDENATDVNIIHVTFLENHFLWSGRE